MAKVSKLKAVAPTAAEPTKPKLLAYGAPGVGKSWFAVDWPSVYYIDTEGGANLPHYLEKLERAGGVYFGPDQGSLDFPTVIEQMQALATEEHPYKTVVIDSLSKLWNTAITHEQERLGDKDAFGASKRPAILYLKRLLNWVNRADLNVLFICQEKDVWGDSGKTGTTFDCDPKLGYELHLSINVVKAGPRRLGRPVKSRLTGFPEGEAFEWNYATFAERYGKDIIERNVKVLELATPVQIAELRHMLENIKLPDGQAQKWLDAAGATSFEEMDAEKLQKLIVHVRSKFTLAAAS